MKVSLELNEPEIVSATASHIVLKDPDTGQPIAEVAIRGAGYIVLTEEERLFIATEIKSILGADVNIPDREDGYHGEPKLWETIAAEQAEKRAALRGGRVVKVAGKKVKLVESLEDINYPDGCKFLEPEDGQTMGIVIVPSRKGEDADMKRFRRACKRARIQQMAFISAQKDPSLAEDGEADSEEGGED